MAVTCLFLHLVMVVNYSLVVFSRKVADGVAVYYSHIICGDYLFAVKKGNNNIMFIAKVSFHLGGFINIENYTIL